MPSQHALGQDGTWRSQGQPINAKGAPNAPQQPRTRHRPKATLDGDILSRQPNRPTIYTREPDGGSRICSAARLYTLGAVLRWLSRLLA